MSEAETVLTRLLEAARAYVGDHVPAGRPALRELLPAAPPFAPPLPQTLPAADRIADMAAATQPQTRALYDAVLAAVPMVRWRRSYDAADGFDETFLERYGWFHLASPRGPFHVDGLRLDVGYFGAGLDYRPHWHAPDEIYVAVAGEAVVGVEGGGETTLGAGGHRVIPGSHRHWLRTGTQAVLILGLQWGDDLLAKSTLADA